MPDAGFQLEGIQPLLGVKSQHVTQELAEIGWHGLLVLQRDLQLHVGVLQQRLAQRNKLLALADVSSCTRGRRNQLKQGEYRHKRPSRTAGRGDLEGKTPERSPGGALLRRPSQIVKETSPI